MKTRPTFLTLIVVTYVACSTFSVFMGAPPNNLVPAMLSLVLSALVFHGSMIASNILAIICAINAQKVLGTAAEAWDSSIAISFCLAATAAVLAGVAHYLLFNKSVQAFQGRHVSILGRDGSQDDR